MSTDYRLLPSSTGLAGRVAAGDVAFAAVERINRCAATNVDPETGSRDLTIPRSLLEAYGHADCGVYLEVVSGGELLLGDRIASA